MTGSRGDLTAKLHSMNKYAKVVALSVRPDTSPSQLIIVLDGEMSNDVAPMLRKALGGALHIVEIPFCRKDRQEPAAVQ